MPEGPATGRVEAKRRALTTPSAAPAWKARWCGSKIWIRKRDAISRTLAHAHEPTSVRSSVRLVSGKSGHEDMHPGAAFVVPELRAQTATCGDDQRWRIRARPDGLGSLAGQDSGVVHAIVGSATATRALAVTAAQSAASMSRSRQIVAIEGLAHGSQSWCCQGWGRSGEAVESGGPT